MEAQRRIKTCLIRTQVWMRVAVYISGLKPHSLEIQVRPDTYKHGGKDNNGNGPNRFKRYFNGTMCAEDKLKNGVNIIDATESKAKGAAYWFRHSLWTAIDDSELTVDEINLNLQKFPKQIGDVLFAPESEGTYNGLPKRLPFDDFAAEEIIKIGGINALSVAMFLIREAEAISSAELRSMATSMYYRIQESVANLPELETSYPMLFTYIDQRFGEWLFASPNERLKVMITWQGIRDHYWSDQGDNKE